MRNRSRPSPPLMPTTHPARSHQQPAGHQRVPQRGQGNQPKASRALITPGTRPHHHQCPEAAQSKKNLNPHQICSQHRHANGLDGRIASTASRRSPTHPPTHPSTRTHASCARLFFSSLFHPCRPIRSLPYITYVRPDEGGREKLGGNRCGNGGAGGRTGHANASAWHGMAWHGICTCTCRIVECCMYASQKRIAAQCSAVQCSAAQAVGVQKRHGRS
ncbi:hypothetical protein BKA80DRAFT_68002 [Phyllosticta citrichinensis]